MSAPGRESAAWRRAFTSPELTTRRQRTYTRKLRRLGLLEPVAGGTLDIACGPGDALVVLARHGQTGLAGVDRLRPDPGTLAPGRVVGDGCQLPFRDGAFERVSCLHSLHHFRSFAAVDHMLAEARRVLAPRGSLYLVDHFDSAHIRTLFRLCEWRCPLYPPAVQRFGELLREEHDCIFWWLDEWPGLFEALQRSGLEVVRQSRGLFFFYLTCRRHD